MSKNVYGWLIVASTFLINLSIYGLLGLWPFVLASGITGLILSVAGWIYLDLERQELLYWLRQRAKQQRVKERKHD